MKELSLKTVQKEIVSSAEAFQLLNKVLLTDVPIAIWRLPYSDTFQALIDIRGNEDNYSANLESMEDSFLINPYGSSHPVHPLVLKGDLVLTITNDTASVKINPVLSSMDLESFDTILNSPTKGVSDEVLQNSIATDFEASVSEAIHRIKSGRAHKIVLARHEDHELNEAFDPLSLLKKISNQYPGAFCHLTKTKTFGLWMGASPEILLSVDQDRYFSTHALAGTQPLTSDQPIENVAWRQKEIEEQAMVSRYIIDCFKKIRLREFEEFGPKTVRAGNLAHLKTTFQVDMKKTNSLGLGTTMLELLHPTSAVCGYPFVEANTFISEHEAFPRELYAGFLGPVGFNGSSSLFVNLRCMKIVPGRARLFAGAGITEDSVSEKEFEETEFKLQTLLNVLKK